MLDSYAGLSILLRQVNYFLSLPFKVKNVHHMKLANFDNY